MPSAVRPYIVRVALFAAAYILTGLVGLLFVVTPGNITPLWLPSGLALAVLLLGGDRLWPGIFIGSIVLNILSLFDFSSDSGVEKVIAAVSVAGASSLQALLLSRATRRLGGTAFADRALSAVLFSVLAAPLCSLVAPTLSIGAMRGLGLLPAEESLQSWLVFWFGDFAGVVTLAPLLIGLFRPGPVEKRSVWEVVSALTLTFVLTFVAFAPTTPWAHLGLSLSFLAFPVSLLLSFRFGLRGAGLSILVIALGAAWGTVADIGTFAHSEPIRLPLYTLFMQHLSVISLAVVGARTERRYAELALRESNIELEARVSSRTDELTRLNRHLVREGEFRSTLLDTLGTPVIVFTPQGRIELVNRAATLLTGHERSEMEGRPLSDFIAPSDLVQMQEALRQLLRTRSSHSTMSRWVRKDGEERTVQFTATCVAGDTDRVDFVIGAGLDVTEREALEVKLTHAVQLRDEFLSVAAHELKTPLTALALTVQSLKSKSGGLPPKLLERAQRQVERLVLLVQVLLDTTQIQAGRFELSRATFEFSSMAADVVQRFEAIAAQSGSSITLRSEPVTGYWDRFRLDLVLTNILGNALKYGAGSPVEIQIRLEGEELLLRVLDNGVGVPQEALERIFGRFERAVSKVHYGGLGLGLYIVRQIVDAHGGSVRAEARETGGIAVTVRLPLDSRRPSSPARPDSPPDAEPAAPQERSRNSG